MGSLAPYHGERQHLIEEVTKGCQLHAMEGGSISLSGSERWVTSSYHGGKQRLIECE